MGTGCLSEHWQQALDLAVDGAAIDGDTALSEPLDDSGIAQPEPNLPAHGESDHISGERAVREGTGGADREATLALSTPVVATIAIRLYYSSSTPDQATLRYAWWRPPRTGSALTLPVMPTKGSHLSAGSGTRWSMP